MHKTVLQTIKRHGLFRTGDIVVVAVSGGADSVALFHLLHSLEELRLRLVAAHFNHLLRGADSDGDEEFVIELAVALGVPCEVKRLDVREFASLQRLSLEEAGRVCRYAFFDQVAAKHGAAVVALAHHGDDQAETVLMRLLRGSATTGLCGMSPKSANGRYVRPLLGVDRLQVESYLDERNLVFRNDASNSDTTFLRNRVRLELLPYLETYNPAIRRLLTATADALAADEAVMDQLSRSLFAGLADRNHDRVTMSAELVRHEPQGVRFRLYRCALESVKGNLHSISRCHLDDMDGLVHATKPHLTLVLPDGTTVGKSYDMISVEAAKEPPTPTGGEIVIAGPGRYAVGSFAVTVGAGSSVENMIRCGPDQALFDGDAAPFPWLARTFRNGDRFVPFAMTGRKKVKDLFIDEKVPRDLRNRIPLLFRQDELLWVGGIRRSAAAPVTSRTTAIITVDIEPLEP